jgi:hypothetical protein
MPAPKMKSLDLNRMPTPFGGQYFLREVLSESNENTATPRFKMTFGFVGRIPTDYEKLTVMPYLGIGFLTMQTKKYDVILKENGTNMQYETRFVWRYDESDKDNYEYNKKNSPLGYLNVRMNAKYKYSEKTNILVGLEYTRFFSSIDFYGRHVNMFNHNIYEHIIVEGNKMNMLGLSVGISF